MTRLLAGTFTLLLASGLLATAQQSDNELISTSYDLPPSFADRIEASASSFMDGDGLDKDRHWMNFFREMGVQWPKGSSVRYDSSASKLFVVNTGENLRILDLVFSELGPGSVSFQIEIEVQFVEFQLTDLDRLAATKGIIDAQTLRALWQQGKAELLYAPKVVTQAGEEATVKGVTEYIYPTEFEVCAVSSQTTNSAADAVGALVEPGSFETREVGVILSVLPDVSPEGSMINLVMTPEVVYEPVWRDYGSDFVDSLGNEQHAPMEQPFFYTQLASTSISIQNGATILFGGGLTSRDKCKVVYTFITARLVDIEGKPVGRR
jgi:type II secretory pathway component GspD/PulD (secretin)